MTGVDKLRNVRVVSAAPDAIRVSVLGGRTQLDIALPPDVPVAAFLPELAKLIGSRDAGRDEDAVDRDERRTFWVLTRLAGNAAALAPDETLRAAGVKNGELLRISARRALPPPTLYDDVVDAAARLNRAAYAPWNATAAGVMAYAGLWLCAAAWVFFLVAEALSAHRVVVVVGASLTTAIMVGGAALVHRTLGRADIAAAVGWPAIAITAALGWALAARFGAYGLAAVCAVLLALIVVYYRVIGTGHWAYVASAVVFIFGGLAFLSRALDARVDVLAAVATTSAALGCLAVPTLTAKLGTVPSTAVEPKAARRDRDVDNPLGHATDETSSVAAMPSADEVWSRVRSAALTRAGLLVGLAAVVTVGASVLLQTRVTVAAFMFALVCAAVLALRGRQVHTVPERGAVAVPATALLLIACAQVQTGSAPLPATGVAVLVAVAVLAVVAGLAVTDGRLPRWVSTAAAYADYTAVAALIPLVLWALW